MPLRNFYLSIVIVLLFWGLSFATGLATKEAINYYYEGINAEKQSNFDQADAAYSKVLLLDPYNKDYKKYILNNLGVRFAEQGDFEKAEEKFKEALKIDPYYKIAQLNLGLIYDRQGDKAKSQEYWLKVLDINIEKLKPKSFTLEELKK